MWNGKPSHISMLAGLPNSSFGHLKYTGIPHVIKAMVVREHDQCAVAFLVKEMMGTCNGEF